MRTGVPVAFVGQVSLLTYMCSSNAVISKEQISDSRGKSKNDKVNITMLWLYCTR